MNRRNLLPPNRIAAKRHRRAARRWVAINSAYAVLLLVAGLSYAISGLHDADDAMPYVAAAAAPADVAQLNTKLVSLRQQSMTLKGNLQSVLDVTGTPDWSDLLSVFASSLGEDVVLTGMEGSADPGRPVESAPQRFTLAGVGRSQAAVSGFILRVEALRLFSKVALTQATAQPRNGEECVGFRIVCTLPDGEK